MGDVGKLHEAIAAAGVTATSVVKGKSWLTAVYPGGNTQAENDLGDEMLARGPVYVEQALRDAGVKGAKVKNKNGFSVTYPPGTSGGDITTGDAIVAAATDHIKTAIEAVGTAVTSVANNYAELSAVYPDGTSQADIDAGNALIARGNDYIVLKDGATVLADDELVTITANDTDSKAITVQYKNADDSNGTGDGDAMTIDTGGGVCPIDKVSGTLDGSGNLTFTLGPTTMRGQVAISVQGGPTAGRQLRVKFE